MPQNCRIKIAQNFLIFSLKTHTFSLPYSGLAAAPTHCLAAPPSFLVNYHHHNAIKASPSPSPLAQHPIVAPTTPTSLQPATSPR